MLSVPPGRVQYWVEEKMLLTKNGRITERSLSTFLSDFPEKVPYQNLSPDMRGWLREMGFRADEQEPKSASAGYSVSATTYSSAAQSQSANDGYE
jgi:hypothetical protein